MRLNNLHNRSGKLRLLYEDETGQPLEPSRYPAVKRHVIAEAKPLLNILKEVDALQNMVFEYPKEVNPSDYKEAVKALRRAQAAFKRLTNRMGQNPVSGLGGSSSYDRMVEDVHGATARRKKFNRPGPGEFIVISADLDDTGFLNTKSGLGHMGVNAILQNVGKLFQKSFSMDDTHLFHPGGDEFKVISKLGDDPEEARLRFAQLLKACMDVSNGLAETGFYLDGWPDERRIQPTLSFGISNSDLSSEGLLRHVKAGAASGKPIKFVIVNDRDLRYDLGFSPEEMSKYVQQVQQPNDELVSLDSPDVAFYESKLPMDNVRDRRGPIICEASWSENPHKKKLALLSQKRKEYLDKASPEGVLKWGNKYIPLKESFQAP